MNTWRFSAQVSCLHSLTRWSQESLDAARERDLLGSLSRRSTFHSLVLASSSHNSIRWSLGNLIAATGEEELDVSEIRSLRTQKIVPAMTLRPLRNPLIVAAPTPKIRSLKRACQQRVKTHLHAVVPKIQLPKSQLPKIQLPKSLLPKKILPNAPSLTATA